MKSKSVCCRWWARRAPNRRPIAKPPLMPSGRARRAARPRSRWSKPEPAPARRLGYLAPASLWAEKNGPGLWISTYTRNLQRQLVQEIAHLYPDPAERAEKAVVRKGRENYLCLLNFEEAAKRTALAPGQRSVALGLIARWIASRHRRRYVRRGLSGFPGRLPAVARNHRPARRMHLCRLPALPHLLHRARHPPRPPRAHRHRQSCAGDRPGRQRLAGNRRDQRHPAGAPPALCLRRRPSSVRRRRFRLRGARCRAARWRICAAGSAGPRRAPAPACAGWRSGSRI